MPDTFTYDSLDRLRTAGATGGTGGNGDYATGTYTYTATGNILSLPGIGNYSYNANASGCAFGVGGPKPHAVSQAGVYSLAYDCNGNVTLRNAGGTVYNMTYDVENHLTGITTSATATFAYDGDGNRVLGTVNGTTTVYVGNYYEWTGSTSTAKKYYYAGALRVAMRTGTSTVNFLLGDHLGSTNKIATAAGAYSGEERYMPFGKSRYAAGANPTSFAFTGQREESSLHGLLFYNARWYDPALGRFLAADTLVPGPGNPQALNRYSMVLNNPLKYTDPTGHCGADVGSNAQDLFRQCDWLRSDLTRRFGIGISGSWFVAEMQILFDTLIGAARFVGGDTQLAALFQDALDNKGSGAEKLTINRLQGKDTGAGWRPDLGEINIGDRPFSRPGNYLYMGPSELGMNNDNALIARGVILHEISHVLIDARPGIVPAYQKFRDWAYSSEKGWLSPRDGRASRRGHANPHEELATSMAIFINSSGGKASSYSYQYQLEFVRRNQSTWTQ